MAFNIQDFRSQMALDGARYNLFECTMTFPGSVVTNVNGISEKFTFMCHSGNGLSQFGMMKILDLEMLLRTG